MVSSTTWKENSWNSTSRNFFVNIDFAKYYIFEHSWTRDEYERTIIWRWLRHTCSVFSFLIHVSYFPIFCHPWNVNQMKNGRRRKKGDFIWIYDFFPLWPDAVTSLLLVCIFAKRTICIFDWTCFYPRKDDHSGLKIGKIVQYFKGDTKWWKYDTWIRKENAEHVWHSHCQIIVMSSYIFSFFADFGPLCPGPSK